MARWRRSAGIWVATGLIFALSAIFQPKSLGDSALAALGTKLEAEELHELERNYTPCDLINDYTAGKRIARETRAAQGVFADVAGNLDKAA